MLFIFLHTLKFLSLTSKFSDKITTPASFLHSQHMHTKHISSNDELNFNSKSIKSISIFFFFFLYFKHFFSFFFSLSLEVFFFISVCCQSVTIGFIGQLWMRSMDTFGGTQGTFYVECEKLIFDKYGNEEFLCFWRREILKVFVKKFQEIFIPKYGKCCKLALK